MIPTASWKKSPLTFFVLVFALSLPFWLVGAVTGLQLHPGLPVGALMFVCPAIAAMFLIAYSGDLFGIGGTRRLGTSVVAEWHRFCLRQQG